MGAKSRKREREPANGEPASAAPVKRRRQTNEETLRLSELYEHLAAEDEEVRLRAAKQIIVKFSPDNGPSAEATEKALQRLIRGLCSQRKAARLGFCITLTELLRQLFDQGKVTVEGLSLDVDGVIKLVEENTKVEGNVAGQERRDHAIGKLFGFKAVIQSSILFEPEVLLECWDKVLDHVCGMARDIPWLREECGMVLFEAVKNFESRPVFEQCVQQLLQRLGSFRLAHTPEGVAIWLLIQRTYSDSILPDNVWYKKDPLGKKERPKLARVMKEDFRTGSDTSEDGTIKTAGANPNPIFAWDVVLSEMVQRDGKQASTKNDMSKSAFPQFWIDVVDNNLFSSSASHERKSWGFKLFSSLITSAPDWAIPSLFSANLMRSLINQSKKKDRFLHAASLAALTSVQLRVRQEPSSAASIFDALTSKNGIIDIDNVTRTKTLEQVVQYADNDSLRKIVRRLQSIHHRPDTLDQKTADIRRQCIGDIVLNIVKGYQNYETVDLTTGDDSWLKSALSILIDNAYFIPNRTAKTEAVPLPPISDTTRKVYQERLSSCLSRLLRTGDEASSYAYLILGMIRSRPDSTDHPEMIFKAEDSVKKTIKKAFKTLDSISEKGSKSSQKSTTAGFVLLYAVTLLQVFNGDGDAVLMLDDLDSARKALLKQKKTDETGGQDAFVEVLLTFLGNERTLFSKIAEEAFTVFASNITSHGLQSLTDILDTPESLEGQKELFAQGEDGMEEDGFSDDMENASDVEMIDEGAEESADSGSEDDSDRSASESEEEDDDEELTNFENKIALALQTSKRGLDAAGSDESSDESDMDDDQMEALDPHLEQIFKQRKQSTNKKQERKDAKQNVVQFKSRVLDLLSNYLKKEYSNPLSLDILLPLLRRIRAGTNKKIAEKSMKILKAYCDTRAHHKAPLPNPEEVEPVWELLKAIHEESGQGSGAKNHLDACSTASLHVVKVLLGMDMANYSKVSTVYKESQKEGSWGNKSTMVTRFQDWCKSKQLGK